MNTTRHGPLASFGRTGSLVRKEARQMVRDPSALLIGILLPAIMVLLFGYGLTLDIRNVNIAIVMEDPSPVASDLASGFRLSPFFTPRLTTSMRQATDLMMARRVDAIVRIRPEFARDLAMGKGRVQVIAHGDDANRARSIDFYAQGVVSMWVAHRADRGEAVSVGPVRIEHRLWFNDANDSRHFLVPGLIVLVMTLIGAFLTAMVVAREWERGTFESLFVTPVRPVEILLGKTVPYFCLGMIGMALCVVAARVLFHVPLRGSLLVLAAGGALYLLVALGMGLVISAVTKNQFVASQLAVIISFLPALMLSGFLFDLRSMPRVIEWITRIVPARYCVTLMKSLFLAGDITPIILKTMAVMAAMATVLLFIAQAKTRKRLD
jgi:ABC-2 type transport system permease protein